MSLRLRVNSDLTFVVVVPKIKQFFTLIFSLSILKLGNADIRKEFQLSNDKFHKLHDRIKGHDAFNRGMGNCSVAEVTLQIVGFSARQVGLSTKNFGILSHAFQIAEGTVQSYCRRYIKISAL
jgi:hypothetical protein